MCLGNVYIIFLKTALAFSFFPIEKVSTELLKNFSGMNFFGKTEKLNDVAVKCSFIFISLSINRFFKKQNVKVVMKLTHCL